MVKLMAQLDPDLIFGALANPTRRAMTETLLREGPLAMMTLAGPFGISLPGIKKHVGVLEEAGIVTCRRQGRQNICAVNPVALKAAAEWFDFHSQFWNSSLDRLQELLKEE